MITPQTAQPPQRPWIPGEQIAELHRLKDEMLSHYGPTDNATVFEERWFTVMQIIKMRRPDLSAAVDSFVKRRQTLKANQAELWTLRDRVHHLEAALAPFAHLELAGDAGTNPDSIDPAILKARGLLGLNDIPDQGR